LTPAARNAAKRSRSNVPGFASIVTSASADSGSRARIAASRRSIASGEKRLGVPPPRNTVETLRPQTDGSVLSRSATSASTYSRSGSVPASPAFHACELKSQYGHLERHQGRCTYSASGGSAVKRGRVARGSTTTALTGRPPQDDGPAGVASARYARALS
jgi:hypothetical protein